MLIRLLKRWHNMKVVADHSMNFEWVDDTTEQIPTIPNPIVIPNIGDIITFNLINKDKSAFYDLQAEVTGIKVTIYDTLVGEQIITVSIKKHIGEKEESK